MKFLFLTVLYDITVGVFSNLISNPLTKRFSIIKKLSSRFKYFAELEKELSKAEKIETLVLWIRGRYQNNELSKNFSFDQIIYYNFLKNSEGAVSGDMRNRIIRICNFYPD